jgi:hypothetical protein
MIERTILHAWNDTDYPAHSGFTGIPAHLGV